MGNRRVLSVAIAGLAALALVLGMVGLAGAASPYQPPLTALSKTFFSTTATPAGDLNVYTFVNFSLGANATNVRVEDNFLDGLALYQPGGATLFVWDETVWDFVFLLDVTPELLAQHLNGESWKFPLGWLAAGNYRLDFFTTVPAGKKVGQSIKDTVNFYAAGGWKGKAETSIKIVP